MTDWRALCAELAHEVERYAEDRGDLMPECAERARAALAAEPVAEWPTDEEIIREAIKADLVYRPVDEEPYVFSGFVESHSLNQYVLAFARAVLARYGHQPAPVPVSERLPGPEDCDAEGRCWWLAPETAQKCAVWCFGPKYPPSMFGATHWLPAIALPLPQVEVGP